MTEENSRSRETEDEKHFARFLRAKMVQHPEGPMSISALAIRTGMPRSTINRHLLGKPPAISSLERYAQALDVPLSEMLTARMFRSSHQTRLRFHAEMLAQALEVLKAQNLSPTVRILLETIELVREVQNRDVVAGGKEISSERNRVDGGSKP